MGRIQRAFAGFKWQEPLARPTEELLKAKDRTWLTASKDARTSVLICKKLNSAYNLNELGRGLFQSLLITTQLANILILTL